MCARERKKKRDSCVCVCVCTCTCVCEHREQKTPGNQDLISDLRSSVDSERERESDVERERIGDRALQRLCARERVEKEYVEGRGWSGL